MADLVACYRRSTWMLTIFIGLLTGLGIVAFIKDYGAHKYCSSVYEWCILGIIPVILLVGKLITSYYYQFSDRVNILWLGGGGILYLVGAIWGGILWYGSYDQKCRGVYKEHYLLLYTYSCILYSIYVFIAGILIGTLVLELCIGFIVGSMKNTKKITYSEVSQT